jgi:hypothetical protein
MGPASVTATPALPPGFTLDKAEAQTPELPPGFTLDQQKQETAPQQGAGGMLTPGNIDLNTRPQEKTTAFKETLANAINQSAADTGMGGIGKGTEGIIGAASEMLGFGGFLAGGTVGLIAEMAGMPRGYAQDLAERSAKNLTYRPKSEEGKAVRDTLMYPFEKVMEASHAAGEGVTDFLSVASREAQRSARQNKKPDWFPGTKDEYVKQVDKFTAEEGLPAMMGAVTENALAMGLPLVGGEMIGKGVGKAVDVADRVRMKEAKTPTIEDHMAEAKKPTTTPEERTKLIDEIKKQSEERKQTSPIVETAIRNKETGEIERMGPKHDEARKAETKDTHEQGFITERGQFLTRKEALDQAKRTKQIPENHVLDFPDEGLHSGDLFKAGDQRFATPERQGKAPEEKISTGEVTEGPPPEDHFPPPVDSEEHIPVGETHEGMPEDFKPMPSAEKAPETRQEYKYHIGQLENARDEAFFMGDHEREAALNKQIQEAHRNMPQVDFKDKKNPTPAEFHDLAWGAKNVGDVLTKMLQHGVGPAHYQALAKLMMRFEGLRNTRIEFTPEQLKHTNKQGEVRNADGLYWGENTNRGKLIQIGMSGRPMATMLHEAVHAGTVTFMDKFPNHPAVLKMNALYEQFKAQDLANESARLRQLVKEGKMSLEEAKTKAAAFADALPGSGREYGFVDPKEFVSEAFSNSKFMKKLSDMKTGGIGDNKIVSMLDKFKDAVADMFKADKSVRTALDDVIDAGHKIMEEQEKEFQAEKKSKADQLKKSEEENKGPLASEGSGETTGSEKVDDVLKNIDVRTIPDRKTFLEHATDIFEKHGEEAAMEFFEAYNKEVKERQIPVPENNKDLDKSFHTLDGFSTRDKSEQIVGYKESDKAGVTSEDRKQAFDHLEKGKPVESIPGRLGEVLKAINEEKTALVRKAKAMGLKVGEEFTSGQNRIRLYGVKDKAGKIWQEFFANKTPLGEKIAEQATEAMERKVFGIEGSDRTVEIHRIQEDRTLKYTDDKGQPRTKEIKKGTEIWEWTKGETGPERKLIARSDNLELGKGEKVKTLDGKGEISLSDGAVHDIERNSPYRYLHDAEASARLSLMGLRKYVREAEFFKNLTESKMFDVVGHGPDKPLETLPKGWRVPNSIDRIPQLRGWHFDPKTAAIIEDFAKRWDNTLYMKLTNQIVKAIMLNPLPHMMNEFMHLWNARGLSGWVSPSGLSSLARTGTQAWKDVMNQTPYYRELMTEGGSILGATPRNVLFDRILESASKEMMGDKGLNRSVGSLAKKIGTTAADLYNGISRKSQQAMWVARDIMYVQYVREIQDLHFKRFGEELSIGDAAEKAGRHMPTYHMPSEVLRSRTLAKALKNPNITTFSSYHYGVLNSLINTVKDVDPRLLKTKEGRAQFRDGVDSMLAIGVALAVLYPLSDKIAEMIFGTGATQRRAGPYHVIEGVTKVMEGEKDLTAVIWPLLTFNPMASLIGQILINKKMFTGKEVYHPDDDIGEKLQDVGNFVVKQMPQGPGIVSAAQDSDEAKSLLAKQLDIKAPTPKTQSIIERAKKRQEIAHKAREKARQHGKYNQ